MHLGLLGNPAVAVLFYAALLVYIGVEARVEWLSRRRIAAAQPSSSHVDRGSKIALVVLSGTGVVIAFLVRDLVPEFAVGAGAVAWTTFLAGVVLLLAASAGRTWAVRTLGRWFTTSVRTDSEQPVIQEGPYRWVRHPSYTSALLALVGIGLVFGNWLSLASFLVFPLIGFSIRIRVEEGALLRDLGSAYANYARHRQRLIPGIW